MTQVTHEIKYEDLHIKIHAATYIFKRPSLVDVAGSTDTLVRAWRAPTPFDTEVMQRKVLKATARIRSFITS